MSTYIENGSGPWDIMPMPEHYSELSSEAIPHLVRRMLYAEQLLEQASTHLDDDHIEREIWIHNDAVSDLRFVRVRHLGDGEVDEVVIWP